MLPRFPLSGLLALSLSLHCHVGYASTQPLPAPFSDDIETYAIHSIDKQRHVAAHIDPLTQALVVSTLDAGHEHNGARMSEKYRTSSPQADVETLCLFEDEQGVGAFLFDVRGMVKQHYLYRKATKQWELLPIREFAVGGEIEYCTVDNASGRVFMAEEGVGVWQISLAPESELVRHLAPLALNEDTIDITLTSKDSVKVTDEKGKVFTFDAEPVAYVRDDLSLLVVDGQTDPVQRFGDAADDPAIWVNNDDPEQSLIIGTDKKAGLDVYNLSGERLQHLPIGKVNNVDVRQSVRFGTQSVDLAVASNRTGNKLSVFNIDVKTRQVSHLADLPTPLNDVYGLCLYQPKEGLEVLVNDSDGTYLRYALSVDNGEFGASLMEQFSVPSQPEGCVADDQRQQLFYGEEASGIWLRSLADINLPSEKVADLNDKVHADIEGMEIYTFDGQRYLVASSQGNDSYAVYAVDDDMRWLGSFRIAPDIEKGIDGASETDGLAISSANLGAGYPEGLLVVQDGRNVMPSDKQNFKLVSGVKLRNFIRQYR
jgi:3-phytase